jgi:hypothetical protein
VYRFGPNAQMWIDPLGLSCEDSKTYYHATSKEAAQKIKETGELGLKNNKREACVFVWNRQPTLAETRASGAYNAETVIKFNTRAAFEPDKGIVNPKISDSVFRTIDSQRVPIKVTDVEEVGFKKRWWQFGKRNK